MLTGDFNDAPDPFLDRSSGKPTQYDNTPHTITNLLFSLGFIDLHQKRHPSSKHYSWYRPNKNDPTNPTTSRINFAFLDGHTAQRYPRENYLSGIANLAGPFTTDHRSLCVSLPSLIDTSPNPTSHPQGPGATSINTLPRPSRWRLRENRAHLYTAALEQNKTLGAKVAAEIKSWRTLKLIWDTLEMELLSKKISATGAPHLAQYPDR